MVPLLTQTPVLDILRKLQQTLDALDIEGLSQLWHRNHGSTPLGTGAPNPSLAEWTEFIDAYLSSRDQMDHGCPSSPTDLRHYLLAYLLAATFKDCSIMLRLDHDVSLGGVVTVIDLDPKGMDRLGKWQKLDGEIVESYIRSGAKQKRCIE